jgi:hypothetical protein
LSVVKSHPLTAVLFSMLFQPTKVWVLLGEVVLYLDRTRILALLSRSQVGLREQQFEEPPPV